MKRSWAIGITCILLALVVGLLALMRQEFSSFGVTLGQTPDEVHRVLAANADLVTNSTDLEGYECSTEHYKGKDLHITYRQGSVCRIDCHEMEFRGHRLASPTEAKSWLSENFKNHSILKEIYEYRDGIRGTEVFIETRIYIKRPNPEKNGLGWL